MFINLVAECFNYHCYVEKLFNLYSAVVQSSTVQHTVMDCSGLIIHFCCVLQCLCVVVYRILSI